MAPFFRASATKRCPSNRGPVSATNRSPERQVRESAQTRRTDLRRSSDRLVLMRPFVIIATSPSVKSVTLVVQSFERFPRYHSIVERIFGRANTLIVLVTFARVQHAFPVKCPLHRL